MAERDVIGVALYGLGRMGMIHIENIIKNFRIELLYIVEEDMERAKKVLKEKPYMKKAKAIHFKDLDTMFKDDNLNAVIIATPTHTHHGFVLQAIKAGRHVFCEKPLSTDLNETIQCYNLAAAKELVLLSAFNRRFDPNIRKMVDNKENVGKLQTVKICSRDAPRPPIQYLKISGGIFHDCVIHDVDALRWIVGENPETIYSIAHCHDPEIAALDDVDTVFVTIKFPCGVLAIVEAQRECVYGYDQTYELYGTKGNLVCSNPRKSSLMKNGGSEADEIYSSFSGRYADAYVVELEHFADLIQKKVSTPYLSAEDAVLAICLSQTAEDSWKERKEITVKEHVEKMLQKCDKLNTKYD